MTIYTKTGDKGTSGTLDGGRAAKTHPIFEANGTVDELSAALGLVRVALREEGQWEPDRFVLNIQSDLVQLGAYLSSGDVQYLADVVFSAEKFEEVIDEALGGKELTAFVIPGDSELEARLHLARTVCRRCERRVVALVEIRAEALVHRYFNRLSDLLFSLAVWSREKPSAVLRLQ